MFALRLPAIATMIAFAIASPAGWGHEFDEDFSIWPTDLKIQGTVIACSPGEIPAEIPEIFWQCAGGPQARIVVIDFAPLPSSFAVPAALPLPLPVKNAFASLPPHCATFDRFSFAAGSMVADTDFTATLAAASGVLILEPESGDFAATASLSAQADLFRQVVERGGVLCGVGRAAAMLGRKQQDDLLGRRIVRSAWGLIPDALLSFKDGDEPAPLGPLAAALELHRAIVGIALAPDSALVLHGRKIRVFGPGQTTFMLAGNQRQTARVQSIHAARSHRANPYRTIVDLTAWRRDAIERQLPAFPPQQLPPPQVPQGSLFIVGGGGMPEGLMQRMVEQAGGEQARMVFVPCSEQDQVADDDWVIRLWQAMGVESAVVLHTKDRHRAHRDEAFLEPLQNATGIWFGGGRQWNLADSYYGTEAHRLMKEVLRRGGVIGGSSAGASIQADYLARANPVANLDIMAPGYERGLGFLRGVAIDQHFSQRGRQKDMAELVECYPQLLGIGIDETTALVVEQSIAQVVGEGQVYFYDRSEKPADCEAGYVALSAGESYDLVQRTVVEK